MGLHHPVDRIAVRDVLLGLKSGQNRQRAADGADQHGPDPHLPKPRSLGDDRQQVEQDGREQ